MLKTSLAETEGPDHKGSGRRRADLVVDGAGVQDWWIAFPIPILISSVSLREPARPWEGLISVSTFVAVLTFEQRISWCIAFDFTFILTLSVKFLGSILFIKANKKQ